MAERESTVEDLEMTSSLASFYQGQRVFLTGHTGFKGGWLATWLKTMGAHVTGFAFPPHDPPTFFDAVRVANGIDSVTGDICDLRSITLSSGPRSTFDRISYGRTAIGAAFVP